jgi:hypothetical protein
MYDHFLQSASLASTARGFSTVWMAYRDPVALAVKAVPMFRRGAGAIAVLRNGRGLGGMRMIGECRCAILLARHRS